VPIPRCHSLAEISETLFAPLDALAIAASSDGNTAMYLFEKSGGDVIVDELEPASEVTNSASSSRIHAANVTGQFSYLQCAGIAGQVVGLP
jgi:hypothetical protein